MEAVELLQPSYATFEEVPQVLSTRVPLADPQNRLPARQRQTQQGDDAQQGDDTPAEAAAAAAAAAAGADEDVLDLTGEAEAEWGTDEGLLGEGEGEAAPVGAEDEGGSGQDRSSIVGECQLAPAGASLTNGCCIRERSRSLLIICSTPN